MKKLNIEALGWDSWFQERAKAHGDPDCLVARVAAVDRDQLLLLNETGAFRGRLSGKYRHESASAMGRPCVGDWLYFTKAPGDQFGIVHGILDRKTCLRRKVAGEIIEYQMIAANVDYVAVVQSCHYDFNLPRLERYLVMVKDGGALPYVLLTKTDRVEPAVLAAQVAQIKKAGLTVPVLSLSNVTKEGLGDLRAALLPGKTYCFVGSSGVGKSTIINGLVGREVLETKAVSGTGEGRHTTVRRELFVLENGAMVIDNPGMRELGVFGAGDGIEENYADLMELSSKCRFRDCTHGNEPGCAVREAVEQGRVNSAHYDNYLKLRSESAYYQMSYAEKRQKDRAFGRFIKSAKKTATKDKMKGTP